MAAHYICRECGRYNVEDPDKLVCVFCAAKRAAEGHRKPDRAIELLEREFPEGLV